MWSRTAPFHNAYPLETGAVLHRTHHISQTIESLSGYPIVQNGNHLFNHNSSSTTRVDHEKRPQRCPSSHSSSYQHSQVLPLSYSWKTLPVPWSPVWSFYGSPRVHQDFSPSGLAITISGNMLIWTTGSYVQIQPIRVINIPRKPSAYCNPLDEQ